MALRLPSSPNHGGRSPLRKAVFHNTDQADEADKAPSDFASAAKAAMGGGRTAAKSAGDADRSKPGPRLAPLRSQKPQPRQPPQPVPAGALEEPRYHLDELLGEGGVGKVYLAHDLLLDTHVAIKILRQDLIRDDDVLQSLKSEAKICMQLTHPHIVRFYDFGQRGNTCYLVMEYVPGQTLYEVMRRPESRNHDFVRSVAMATGSALSYAHAHGVLHNDLTPGNILIGTDGVLKLIDFGIASAAHQCRKQMDFVFGTPRLHEPRTTALRSCARRDHRRVFPGCPASPDADRPAAAAGGCHGRGSRAAPPSSRHGAADGDRNRARPRPRLRSRPALAFRGGTRRSLRLGPRHMRCKLADRSAFMRCLQLTGLRRMRLVDAPKPALTLPSDVLIRVGSVGVCGSDVHYYTTGRIGSQVVQYPFTVGHEFAGTIEAVGAEVRDMQPGDRVAVDPAMPCFACDQCGAGRRHTCRNLRFLGCPGQAAGCLCDAIVMPASSCIRLPADCSLEMGALVEPLSIGAYAAHLAGDLRGKCVAILGCGPIGLSVLLAARHAGAARVYVSDPIAARRAFARQCGAAWDGVPDADLVKGILRHERLAVDVVFECCGQQAALDQAIELLRPGGRLLLIGIPEVDRVSFSIDLLRRRELVIQNVRRQNECVEAGMALVTAFPKLTAAMITHRFSAEQTQAAFDLVAACEDGVVKAMIQFE